MNIFLFQVLHMLPEARLDLALVYTEYILQVEMMHAAADSFVLSSIHVAICTCRLLCIHPLHETNLFNSMRPINRAWQGLAPGNS